MTTDPPTASAAKRAPKPDRDGGVQVLARAAEILRLLKLAPGGMTQAEMAASLGLARTTIHRILSALAAEGLVEPGGAGSRFRLGAEILRMAEAARSALVTEIHPLLQALSRELDETVDLSVLERSQVTFIDQVVAAQRLRTVSVIGASFPLHCTANGKALLAAMSERDLERALPDELGAMTPNTITSLSALRQELDRIRAAGVAFDLEEHSLGIRAVGMALTNSPVGQAAISIPMPAQRFEQKKEAALAAMRRTISQIDAVWRRKG